MTALPKHNYVVAPAAREAGFAASTADKQGKRIVKAAMKHEVKELSEQLEGTKIVTKQMMRDIVGLSREQVMEALRNIATQTRDLASALKVLGPLAKQDDVILQTDEQKNVTVPILNVTVKEKGTQSVALQSPIQE